MSSPYIFTLFQASTSGTGNSSDAPAKGRQHLVKWKGKSYIHCTWVGEDEIQRATKLPLISSSTRSKLRKVLADAEVEARMVGPFTYFSNPLPCAPADNQGLDGMEKLLAHHPTPPHPPQS